MAKSPRDPNTLSSFALALKARNENRPVEFFDVSGLFGPGDVPIPKIGIRIPTKAEQDRAIANAHKYVHEVSLQAHPASDAVKNDRDVVSDAKAAAVIFEFCRVREDRTPDKDDPATYAEWAAFPSPRWACEHLTTEQIAVILNLANEYRAKQAPSPIGLDDDTVEDYIAVCITQNNPEYLLVALNREYLVQLLILVSAKLGAARNEVKLLADENAMLKLRLGIDENIVLTDGDWTAAGIRYTPPGATADLGQRYLIACRDPDGAFHYGPRLGTFLGVLDHAPTRPEIQAFLSACQAGDIGAEALGSIEAAPLDEASAPVGVAPATAQPIA